MTSGRPGPATDVHGGRWGEQLELFVNSVVDYAIFALDPEGRIVTWNRGAERLKGYDADEIIGEHFSRFYTDADRRAGLPDAGLSEAREQGRWESEGWRVRRDGTRFWANVVITALRDRDGELRGFAKVTRDLTERKRNEDALRAVLAREREAAAQLRALDRMRSDLVAVIAHDLRAPVGVVQSLLHLLRSEWRSLPDGDKVEHLQRIAERMETLAALVDDVFDLARIDAGQLHVDVAPVDLGAVVERVVADVLTTGTPRTITTAVADDAYALGDERRTWQVVSNLVSNAVKFSPEGSPVDVKVERAGDQVVVSVADAGEGIALDQQDLLFQRFTRLPATERTPGSGIGLFIAKSLVEAQGGTISVDSAPGIGSTFRFTLPAAP